MQRDGVARIRRLVRVGRTWHDRARRLSRLATSPAERAKVYATFWRFRLMHRFGHLPGRPVSLSLAVEGSDVRCTVWDWCDLYVLKEVLGDRTYDAPGRVAPRVIVDVGANVGMSVLFFHARYPEAQIYAFEPDPTAFQRLQRNVGALPRVVLRNVAVGAEDGTATLFSSTDVSRSSLSPRDAWDASRDEGPVDGRPVQVQMRTLRTLLGELGVDHVDLVKMDIEGAEWDVFPTLDWPAHVDELVGELHYGVPTERRGALTELLRGFRVDVGPEQAGVSTFRAVREPRAA